MFKLGILLGVKNGQFACLLCRQKYSDMKYFDTSGKNVKYSLTLTFDIPEHAVFQKNVF